MARRSLPFSVVGVTDAGHTDALKATFASATSTLEATVSVSIFIPCEPVNDSHTQEPAFQIAAVQPTLLPGLDIP